LQTWTAEAVSYTFGVWLKRKTGTGNIQIAADSGTWTTVTITSSWALYTVTQTPAAGSKSAGIRIVTSGDEVYAWGAHLYRSDLGGMQTNTSAYPYYNPTTPKNLLGFTESLTTGWTNTNTTDSVVSEVNPNGLTGAVEVTATAGNGTLLGSLSLLASPYTFSIYLKRKTGTGTIEITVDGTTYVTAAVTSDWQRFSTTLTPSAGTKTPGIRIVTSGDAVYAWGAQLSDSASLDPYVANAFAAPTAGAYHGPRRDFDPVTLACKGLLVEEQRTNLLLYSSEFSNAYWTKQTVTLGASGVAPDGTTTAPLLIPSGSPNVQQLYRLNVVASSTCVMSIFAKASNPTVINTFDILDGANGANGGTFNLSTGLPTNKGSGIALMVPVGNGWYRCVAVATTTGFRLYCPTPSSSASGDGTNGLYIWGAQLEAGSFATSYIPTTESTVTRSADVASVATSAFPYSSTEGSLVAAFTPVNVAAARRAAQLDDDTANERITLGINSTPNGLMTVIDDGSSQAAIATGTPAANTTMKLAARYKVNDFAVSANGAAVGTDTSGTLPTMNRLRLGSGASSTEPLNGWLRQITYLPRALTDAELQARSA